MRSEIIIRFSVTIVRMGQGVGMMAGMILVTDILELCESETFIATREIDLTGDRNAWARNASPLDRIGIH